ncbi:MAG: DNA polymerase ligase N-terminal domain-containing protein [Elusimicrobiota bacterium]
MPKFVVHKHKAKTLHYDFRLEIDDVLKSWVIPKGPSLNPDTNRLAIQVEDHPITYIHFEGEIPQGQYGHGEVIVWDRGDYEYEEEKPINKQLENGSIEFILRGEKLKGKYRLIRMKKTKGIKSHWILKKLHDEFISYEDITKQKPGSVISMRRIKE